jgi:formylglycine-generating enzyme required for sulfatase activity
MAAIPAGKCLMGTSDELVDYMLRNFTWADDWDEGDLFQVEQPFHSLILPAFEIGRFPVTNDEYYQFVWEAGYRVPKGWLGFKYNEEEAANPIVGVSRADAMAYCKWLTEKMAVQGSPHGAHGPFRLPSEAEWERAARGNDARIYPWGNDFDPWRCNTKESCKGGTTPVGSFSPSGDSPWGIVDMVGNVWEWTNSTLRSYPYDPNDGREDVKSQDVCVIRGGAWYYSHRLARCSSREGALPGYTSNSLGFRVARSIL